MNSNKTKTITWDEFISLLDDVKLAWQLDDGDGFAIAYVDTTDSNDRVEFNSPNYGCVVNATENETLAVVGNRVSFVTDDRDIDFVWCVTIKPHYIK